MDDMILKIENEIRDCMQKLFPDNFEIKVAIDGIDFEKTLSDPYLDKSGSEPDMVSSWIKRKTFRLKIIVDNAYNPYLETK